MKLEAQQALTQAQAEAAELSSRARTEADDVLGRVNQEAAEILAVASAEADDVVVRANAEADVIVARATTVAAEKVLAKRSASPSLAGKGVTSDRLLNEKNGSEASSPILSPEESAPSDELASSSATDLGALASRLASATTSTESETVISPQSLAEPQTGLDSNPLATPVTTSVTAPGNGAPVETVPPSPVTRQPEVASEPASATPLTGSQEVAPTPVVPEPLAEVPSPVAAPQSPPVVPVVEAPAVPDVPPVVAPTPEPPKAQESPAPSLEMPPTPATAPSTPFTLPPLPGEIVKLQALVGEEESGDVTETPFADQASIPPAAAPQASPFIETTTDVAMAGEVPPVDVPEMAPAEILGGEIPPMASELNVASVAPNPVAVPDPAANGGPFTAVVEAEPVPIADVPETASVTSASALQQGDLLGIVSARTGFPFEMLEEHLESGTKLDLTPPKVVEIISDIKGAFPSTPELSLTRIPEFLDLGRLVGFLVGSSASSAPTAPPSAAAVEPEVAIPAPASPFQVAAEAMPPPVVDQDGSPFQPVEPIAAVPSSPFAMAVESMASSDPVEEAMAEPAAATPFQAVAADSEVAPAERPFTPATSEAPSSPFVEVTEPELAAVEVPAESAPAVTAEPVPSDSDVPVDRHVIRGQVAAACGLGLPQLHFVDKIHLVPDDRRVAEALRDLLLAEGFQAEVTDSVPLDACAAIVMSGLSEIASLEQASAIQLEAFKAARSVVHGLGERRGLFVTVQDTGGDFGMSASSEKDAWAGGLPGLARTVAAEWPDIGVKALDVEREGRSAEVLARRILRELTDGGPEVEVGLSSDGTRLTQGVEATELSQPGLTSLPEDGTVVVHGAGNGILTSPVVEMAKRQRQRFALLGSVVMQEEDDDTFATLNDPEDIRRALIELSRHQGEHAGTPEIIEQQLQSFLQQREVRRLIRELRAAGSNVCYFAVDSTDASALEAVLAQVRSQWGGVAALLHASASREESRIEGKTDAQVAQVLRSNLLGVEHLLALTKQDPIQLIGFLSPSLHESGSAGHADYAMANETLNRIACAEAHRRGANCVIRSINWAFCDDGTVSSQTEESLSAQGIQMIPRAQTGRVIVDEFSNNSRGDIQVLLAPRRPSGRAVLHTSYLNSQSEVQIDQANSPQLEDHKVQGVPAVPGVMVMEWFLRNARQTAGSKGFLRCRDFQQLQGIALPDYGTGSVPFSIVMDSLSSFQWGGQSSVRLVDADGQLRYAALLEQVEDLESLGLTKAPELELERTAWTGSHVYGPGALFHGPAFQVIHRVEGVSPQGALGRLVPPEDAGWPEDTYLFHPAMIDGITQLAFVWGLFTQDSEFFVTSIGEFVQAPQANYNQGLRCVLEGLESSPEYLRLNGYLESDGGETLAVMRNVECHPVPGRSQA